MTQLECSGRPIRMARRTTFGPNYILEAYLRGPIDARTGMLINLIDIDKILKSVVTTANTAQAPEKLDRHLFSATNAQIPTTFPGIAIKLEKIRLVVSEDLYLEFGE